MTARNGSADWSGSVEAGSGTIVVGDSLLEDGYTFHYSYGSRFGEVAGANPEQFVAAALASCFTMGLTALLTQDGHPPDSIHTSARVQLRNIDGAPTLSKINLETEASVPGIGEQQFADLAEQAKQTCPVARALAGIPEIALTSKLVELTHRRSRFRSRGDGS